MSESAVRIRCPNLTCRKVLAVPQIARGKTVRCRTCGASIRVPNKPEAPKKPAAGSASQPDDAKGA
jgi:DNA-directed RNA polymerase subunit RPC12/RpoP